MKMRVSDYIAQFLTDNGIEHVFMLTGGGAMHLNDAIGHKEGLTCIYNHHEQACAIAAECYARIENKIAAVCVTTGPGGTNAITGVVGAHLDSIPMLVISGQVRYDNTARSTGLELRAMGDQEFDITKAVECMTKYCEMVTDADRIRYCLEKALHMAKSGRPGACWLDIPMNIQGAYIESDELVGYDAEEYNKTLPKPVSGALISEIIEKIKHSKRPVIYAGSAIRYSGAFELFRELIAKLNVPVVTCWNSIDEMNDSDRLYAGRGGIMGDRAGNFAVQNADLVLSLGSRLSFRQVGFNYKAWARKAYKIAVDIDELELKKPTLDLDMPVWADVKDVIAKLNDALGDDKLFRGDTWIDRCNEWKKRYPVVKESQINAEGLVNPYNLIKQLSSRLSDNQITVSGNGSACVVGGQAYVIEKGRRYITNSAIASMGYDLPAAIGASIASVGLDENTDKPDIILMTGDGSIQMNLQELQTIIHHKLPIKIFLINNGGYHSIRQTQKNFFGEPLVGIGYDSGDLSFPSMEKLAYAYGYPYLSCEENRKTAETIEKALSMKAPLICEFFIDITQNFEPKSATKRLEDGTLVSAPLEDLAPFLDKDELKENMLYSKST